jgi:hypothetical protein
LPFNAEAALNLFDAIVIIIPAIVTIVLAVRVKNAIGPLKILTTLLALFLIVHGMNHFLGFYNAAYDSAMAGFLANAVVQPLSWAILVAFSVYYLRRAG